MASFDESCGMNGDSKETFVVPSGDCTYSTLLDKPGTGTAYLVGFGY